MHYVLGIDVGTTHCKVVALAPGAKILYEAKAGYPTIQSLPGQSEQDAEEIFGAMLQLLQQSLNALKKNEEYELKGICFSAAMHSMMAVDAHGNALTKVYTWADTRSNAQAMQLRSLPNAYDIYAATGTPIHPMSPLSKIFWLRQEIPQIFDAAAKFISLKEYIFYKLFDKYITDHSMASATGLFDIFSLQWSAHALEAAGITIDKLSRPVPVTHTEIALKENYRQLLGITTNIPFIIGASDGCLANIGSSAMQRGEAAITIGTSGAVRVVVDTPKPDPQQRLFNYILTENLYVTGGPVSNGGSVLKWFSEVFLQHSLSSAGDVDWLLQLAFEAPVGSGGLIFLPYLSGERAPFWDASARGAFVGLQTNHGRPHLARAVIEGISFAICQVMHAVEETNGEIEVVYASGAFANADQWVQLMSNLLNKKIIVSASADASAIGAALLGMHTLGLLQNWNILKHWLPAAKTFLPDSVEHERYQPYYKIFIGLYPKLKEDFKSLNANTHTQTVIPTFASNS
jgi:gluconokinase